MGDEKSSPTHLFAIRPSFVTTRVLESTRVPVVGHHRDMAQKPKKGRPVVPNARRRRSVSEPDAQRRPRQGSRNPLRSSAAGSQASTSASSSRPQGGRKEARTARTRSSATATAQRPASLSFGGIEISLRILGLLLLGALLALLLVPSFMQLWSQERELSAIKNKVQQTQADNEAKRQQLQLWSNPQYIASQARERLGYVKPGETQYSVLDPGKDYQDQAQVAAAREAGPARPWIQVLSLTVEEADHPTGNIQTAQTAGGNSSTSPSETPQPSETVGTEQGSGASQTPSSQGAGN